MDNNIRSRISIQTEFLDVPLHKSSYYKLQVTLYKNNQTFNTWTPEITKNNLQPGV